MTGKGPSSHSFPHRTWVREQIKGWWPGPARSPQSSKGKPQNLSMQKPGGTWQWPVKSSTPQYGLEAPGWTKLELLGDTKQGWPGPGAPRVRAGPWQGGSCTTSTTENRAHEGHFAPALSSQATLSPKYFLPESQAQAGVVGVSVQDQELD